MNSRKFWVKLEFSSDTLVLIGELDRERIIRTCILVERDCNGRLLAVNRYNGEEYNHEWGARGKVNRNNCRVSELIKGECRKELVNKEK